MRTNTGKYSKHYTGRWLVSCSGHITEITPSRHWKGMCLSVSQIWSQLHTEQKNLASAQNETPVIQHLVGIWTVEDQKSLTTPTVFSVLLLFPKMAYLTYLIQYVGKSIGGTDNWQEEITVFKENPVLMPFHIPQNSHQLPSAEPRPSC